VPACRRLNGGGSAAAAAASRARAARQALPARERMPTVIHRVVRAHAAPKDLRALLQHEWATISVIAGLIVLLQGTASLGTTLPNAGGEPPGYEAVRFAFFGLNVLSFTAAVTSALVALFLLHASNSVPHAELHAFLLSIHALLWTPLAALLVAFASTTLANACAALIIYASWAAFAVRAGVGVAWMAALAAVLRTLLAQAEAHDGRGRGGA